MKIRISAKDKNILRTLKGNLRRFLSIFLIVALGSGFMAGLLAASPDMYETADRYFDDLDWYDLDVRSLTGFLEKDAEIFRQQDFAAKVQAARVLDLVLTDETDSEHTARVFGTLGEDGTTLLNKVKLVSGRFPENAGECVVQTTLSGYDEHPLGAGDILKLPEDRAEGTAASDQLTVVGIVESPMCISLVPEVTNAGTGSIALNVFAQEDFFIFDGYTDLYVALTGAEDLDSFSDQYQKLSEEAAEKAEKLPDARTAALCSAYEEGVTGNRETVSMLQDCAPALAVMLETAETTEDAVQETARGGGRIAYTRADEAGYDSYKSNVGKVAALAGIFPVFFFLVALLVALTAMTRLVNEKRTEIGVKKALGVSNLQILAEYLFYALITSVPGCILGFLAGFRIFPMAISRAYGMMFFLPETVTPFRADIALWVAPVTVGSILAATAFSCMQEVRSMPAPLLLPKAPSPGKRILLERIPLIWKPMSFLHKVTARNLFRYRKRFFMTVIGIMGCSALLVTGFGLKDSVNDIVEVQFEEISHYQLTAVTDSENAPEKDAALKNLLTDTGQIQEEMAFFMESGRIVSGRKSEEVRITVPEETERFDHFITLRSRTGRKALPLKDQENGAFSVILTEKLCSNLGLRVGDAVTFENEDGTRASLCLAGISENYLESCAYLTKDTYASLFKSSPRFLTHLCITEDGTDEEALTAAFLSCPHVLYAGGTSGLKDNFSQALRSMDGVVLVLILAAGLLCIVVLYNLIGINICERRKELATIEVLGFHEKETRQYVFRETNVLSLLGALAGLLLGRWLHGFVVRTIEIDQVMFGRRIHLSSYLLAIVITMAFTLLVNRMMRRQIGEIDMALAMKGGE